MRDAGMQIVSPLGPPNLEPRDDIWPSESAPVFRAAEGGLELAQLTWGFKLFQGSAGDQLQVGRPLLREQQAMPRACFALLRIQGLEGAQVQVQVQLSRHAVVLLR
jgi:putative SOS response-associated peptidase YedK